MIAHGIDIASYANGNTIYEEHENVYDLIVCIFTRCRIESNPKMKVKYEIHWQSLNQEIISLAKLGLEDCETCLAYSQYINRAVEKFANDGIDFVLEKLFNKLECSVDQCEVYSDQQRHTKLYREARAEYEKGKLKILTYDFVITTTGICFCKTFDSLSACLLSVV